VHGGGVAVDDLQVGQRVQQHFFAGRSRRPDLDGTEVEGLGLCPGAGLLDLELTPAGRGAHECAPYSLLSAVFTREEMIHASTYPSTN
jgi:hypothetical protein